MNKNKVSVPGFNFRNEGISNMNISNCTLVFFIYTMHIHWAFYILNIELMRKMNSEIDMTDCLQVVGIYLKNTA